MSAEAPERGWMVSPDDLDEMLSRLGVRKAAVPGGARSDRAYPEEAQQRIWDASRMVAADPSANRDELMDRTMSAYSWLRAEEARHAADSAVADGFFARLVAREAELTAMYQDWDPSMDPDEARRDAQVDAAEEVTRLFGLMMDNDMTAFEVLEMDEAA